MTQVVLHLPGCTLHVLAVTRLHAERVHIPLRVHVCSLVSMPLYCSVIGQYRSARVKPFRDAGFSTRAVVCVCEESTLQQRQHSAFERDSKFVPDEAIAELKGGLHSYVNVNFNQLLHALHVVPGLHVRSKGDHQERLAE